jgi:hypothetical protein
MLGSQYMARIRGLNIEYRIVLVANLFPKQHHSDFYFIYTQVKYASH